MPYEYTCDLERSDKTLDFKQSEVHFRLGMGLIWHMDCLRDN